MASASQRHRAVGDRTRCPRAGVGGPTGSAVGADRLVAGRGDRAGARGVAAEVGPGACLHRVGVGLTTGPSAISAGSGKKLIPCGLDPLNRLGRPLNTRPHAGGNRRDPIRGFCSTGIVLPNRPGDQFQLRGGRMTHLVDSAGDIREPGLGLGSCGALEETGRNIAPSSPRQVCQPQSIKNRRFPGPCSATSQLTGGWRMRFDMPRDKVPMYADVATFMLPFVLRLYSGMDTPVQLAAVQALAPAIWGVHRRPHRNPVLLPWREGMKQIRSRRNVAPNPHRRQIHYIP